MAFVYDNKEYRNLQEQVFKNMNDISFILQEEGVLNEFGIKVVGQEESVLDMPTVDDYKEDNPEWAYGDAYAIGTEAPYELYVLTRANGSHPDDYWFNIGEFPAPGPEGPEGPQGEQGVQGQTGPAGQDGVSPEFSIGTVSASTISAGQSATASVSMTGTYAQPVLNFAFDIPKGEDGASVTSIPWGSITGSLANQTDLVSALQAKANASALSSYATQVYANNVASNAEYQAVTTIRTSANEFSGSMMFYSDVVFGSYIYKGQSNFIDYPIELPSGSGTLAFQSDIPSLSGYATESWVSANFLSADTPIGGAAQWGSISGTLSDQTDLMSKFSEYALLSDIPSLSGYATEAWVASQNYASQTWVNSQITSSLSDYATVSALSSAISGVNTTIASLDYASVGALSSGTTIPTIPSARSGITLAGGYYGLSDVIPISLSFTSGTSTSFYGHVRFASNATFEKSVCFGGSAIYNGSTITNGFKLSLPSQSGSLALISDIPSLSGYATEAFVSSAIGALDYASVGALSSDTVIPEISGTNDGSYWTSLTINEDTYDIPQGGGSGDYVPVMVDDSDEYHRYSGEVSNSDSAINLQVTKEDSEQVAANKTTSLELYQDDAYLSHSYQELVSKDNPDYDPEDPESSPTIEEAVDLSTNIYVGEGTITVNRATYDEGLQEVVDEQVDLFDLASMSYVNDSISALSSVYQPIGSYVSQADLSGYAKLSASNTFTGATRFDKPISIYASTSASTGLAIYNNDDSDYYAFLKPTRLYFEDAGDSIEYGISGVKLTLDSITHTITFPNKNGLVALRSDIPTIAGTSILGGTAVVVNPDNLVPYDEGNLGLSTSPWYSAYINTLYGSDQVSKPVSQIALLSNIPSLSEYATISAVSSAINDLSSVYASISYVDALSSVYAPISLVSTVSGLDYLSVGALSSGTVIPVIPASLPANGGNASTADIASAVSGYASEVWTFTLSDNTTVSKTILVG